MEPRARGADEGAGATKTLTMVLAARIARAQFDALLTETLRTANRTDMWPTFRRYLLPGFVFQSVVIAGGYGTGREIVEFFLTNGPRKGLLAMVFVTTVIFSVVAAVSFEFARRFRTYDYRTFLKRLLGPGWIAFELGYVVAVVMVIAVIASAAGTIILELFGLPYTLGVIAVITPIAFLLFFGNEPIEKALAAWSFVLYGVYIIFFVMTFQQFGGQIAEALAGDAGGGNWIVDGIRYAGYNVATVPVVLFAARHIQTRRQAVSAGLISGPIVILPGLLFYIAMVGQYPDILDRAVPANHMLELLGSRTFQIAFQIVLFGTLVETGTGMIHAVNERIAGVFRERGSVMPRGVRSANAVIFLVLAVLLSQVGLVNLIAKGYGTITYLFIAVYVIPILTLGVWILLRTERNTAPRVTS